MSFVDFLSTIESDRLRAVADEIPEVTDEIRTLAKDMLEKQVYPVQRTAGGAIERPYDVTGWSLPMQMGVDAVEVAASDLEFAVLLELEAAADDDVGVGDQLGVELAGALGDGDAGLAQQGVEDLEAALEVAVVEVLLGGLAAQAVGGAGRGRVGGGEEQRGGLGSASGEDQRLGAIFGEAPGRRLAVDREAVELGGVVEGEGLGGGVGGGGGVFDGRVDPAAGVQVPGDALAVVALFGEQGVGEGEVAAAQELGVEDLAGGALDRLVEGGDGGGLAVELDQALAVQLGQERAQVGLPGAGVLQQGQRQGVGGDDPGEHLAGLGVEAMEAGADQAAQEVAVAAREGELGGAGAAASQRSLVLHVAAGRAPTTSVGGILANGTLKGTDKQATFNGEFDALVAGYLQSAGLSLQLL